MSNIVWTTLNGRKHAAIGGCFCIVYPREDAGKDGWAAQVWRPDNKVEMIDWHESICDVKRLSIDLATTISQSFWYEKFQEEVEKIREQEFKRGMRAGLEEAAVLCLEEPVEDAEAAKQRAATIRSLPLEEWECEQVF